MVPRVGGSFAPLVAAVFVLFAWSSIALSHEAAGRQAEQSRAEQQAADDSRYGLDHPRPRTPGAVRIATYNIENYFDAVDDPELQGEFDDIKFTTTPQRVRAIAEAIRKVDADVIALQEVESLDALRRLRDEHLPDMGYKHLASRDVGYFRGIECAVMSRFPIIDVQAWPNANLDDVRRTGPGWDDVPDAAAAEGLTFRRSPLRVDIRISDDYELTVFTVHHKASANFRYQREAEAQWLIDMIDELRAQDPMRNIIIAGDFNAAPWDKSLRVYIEAGFVDTLAHRIIPRWRDADQTEANLFKTHQSGRVLDYILMNAGAYNELVRGSAHVFGTLTPPPGWDWRTDPHPPGYAADHYPVIIDLIPSDRR